MGTPDFPLPKELGWQYHFILWIQSLHSPMLDKLAIWLSYLGTESFYLLILPIVFLACSRKNGLRLAYVFLSSMFLNAWLKSVIQIARPIGIPGVRSVYISSGTGLSMPSGHAQGAMTFFVGLSRWFQRRWILIFGLFLVLCVGVSRVYLGLHWPADVAFGWFLGAVVGAVGWNIGRWWSYRGIPFHFALVFAVLFPALLFYFNHDPASAGYATLLFSVGTGAVLERRLIRSAIHPVWWKRVCAAVIGIGGVVAIQWALQSRVDDLPWRLLRDLLVGWWTTMLAPWLLRKVDIYRSEDSTEFVE